MNRSKELHRAIGKSLKDRSTASETMLWPHLRDRNMMGQKFRRQRPLDRFWADFCCDDLKLIIEVDGGIHDDPDQALYDLEREKYLLAKGYIILRIRAEEVECNMKVVLSRIRTAVVQRQVDLLNSTVPLLPSAGEGPGMRGKN